jgi:predicted Zn-dependent peptidase
VFRLLDQELARVRMSERRKEEDVAQRLLASLCRHAAFTGPYARMSEAVSESRASRADIEAFFKTWFTPHNVVVSLVGPIEAARARRWADEYFSKLPGTAPSRRTSAAEPSPEAAPQEKRAVEAVITAEVLAVGWRRPSTGHADDAALRVVYAILSRPETGRLERALRGDEQLAYRIYLLPTYPGRSHANLFTLLLAPVTNRTVEVEAELDRVIQRLREEPVNAEELSAAKSWLRLQALKRLESPAGMAAELARYEAEAGDAQKMIAALGEIQRVTAEEIQRVAGRYLVNNNRVVVSSIPPGSASQ